MATTTKKALIDRIAGTTEQKRQCVKQVIQEFLDEVVAEVGRGNRLEFRDFGVFEIRVRGPRAAQNPKTLERVVVPAKRIVKFRMGRKMRALLERADAEGPPARAGAGGPVETKPRGRTRLGV